MSKVTKMGKAAKAMKKVDHNKTIRTIIRAGQAIPGPPLGPILGQRGIAIGPFCKTFNEATKDIKEGIPLPIRIHIKPDRTYDLELRQPTTSYFLKAAAGIKKGARQTGHEVAGKLTLKHIYEIACIKAKDEPFRVRDTSVLNVCKSLIGTARSLGLQVVPFLSAEEYRVFLEEREVFIKKREEEDQAAAAEALQNLRKK